MFPMQVWVETLSFRPLTGIMVLIHLIGDDLAYLLQHSFRPLTGIMVLILDAECTDDTLDIMFPSPYGDYGSYRQAATKRREILL